MSATFMPTLAPAAAPTDYRIDGPTVGQDGRPVWTVRRAGPATVAVFECLSELNARIECERLNLIGRTAARCLP